MATMTPLENPADQSPDTGAALINQKFTEVDTRFDRVDKDIAELKSDTKAGFAELRGQMSSLQRTLLAGVIVLVVALISASIASIAA